MKKFLFIALSFLLPVFAFAQPGGFGINNTGGATSSQDAIGLLGIIRVLINTIVPILITIIVVFIIIGAIQYVSGKEDDDKKAGGKKMINGLIGLFVVLSTWGILSLISNSLGIDQGGTLNQTTIPSVQ